MWTENLNPYCLNLCIASRICWIECHLLFAWSTSSYIDWIQISNLVTHNSRQDWQFSSVTNSGLVSIVRPMILLSAVSLILIASCSEDEYLILFKFVISY